MVVSLWISVYIDTAHLHFLIDSQNEGITVHQPIVATGCDKCFLNYHFNSELAYHLLNKFKAYVFNLGDNCMVLVQKNHAASISRCTDYIWNIQILSICDSELKEQFT